MVANMQAMAHYAAVLKALHAQWTPHKKQIEIGQAIFRDGVKRIFIQSGRRFGKTEFAAYAALRWALTVPNSTCYIVGPLQRQMREILWSSGRLQRLVPPEYVSSINNTEMRINLTNGSFVKVDGSDDVDGLRGLRISFLVLDEFASMRAEVLDTVLPALTDYDAPLVIVGTPPEVENHYVTLSKEAQEDPLWRYFHAPSSSNPYLKPEVLERERKRLTARGDEEVWIREYEARYVSSGRKAIFPMFSETTHVAPFQTLRERVYKNPVHWQFYCGLDPGTQSTFAGVLCATNVYTGEFLVLDEFHATNQAETTAGRVWPVLKTKMQAIWDVEKGDEEWNIVSDSAASWFIAETLDRFGISIFPSQKHLNKKSEGVGLIKDLLLSGKMLVSDRCPNLVREMKAYRLSDIGQFIKKDDHSIDALRYALGACHYTAKEDDVPEPVRLEPGQVDDPRRAFTPAQDFRSEDVDMFGEAYLLEAVDDDW